MNEAQLLCVGIVLLHNVTCWSLLPLGDMTSRIAVALVLTLCFIPEVATSWHLVVDANLRTAFVALLMGALTGCAWASLVEIVASIGELFDLQRGQTLVGVYDGNTGITSSFALLLKQFSLHTLALMGMFPLVCASCHVFVTQPKLWVDFSPNGALSLLSFHSGLFEAAVVVCAPVMAAHLGIDWVVGKLHSNAPGLQPMVDGFVIKSLVLLLLCSQQVPLLVEFLSTGSEQAAELRWGSASGDHP